ncbi:putative glycosyltransferase [Dorcoceras hygrometricum]|uniref:Putative glycosyltransferase n=1 Tax=Dorcoceras hygrometricum TaxID=472368 RepID=A0A2Z6ZRM6_9LAMI|nr:putative glycosyltransferase [Dorcoceras hygrometricum]
MAAGHEETTACKLLCDVGGRCTHERMHYGRDLRDCRASPLGAWRRIAMEVGRYCAQVKRGGRWTSLLVARDTACWSPHDGARVSSGVAPLIA